MKNPMDLFVYGDLMCLANSCHCSLEEILTRIETMARQLIQTRNGLHLEHLEDGFDNVEVHSDTDCKIKRYFSENPGTIRMFCG
ncbi:MAG: hypothetical protein HQM12_15140 [SAR324 cluster bacterium]|nr:hypothetical protein [SAR324 cluster bacterium]